MVYLRQPYPALSAEDGKGIVQRVFGGVLQSDVICCACGHTSTAHDPFLDISLDIKAPPIPPPPLLRPPAAAGRCVSLLAVLNSPQASPIMRLKCFHTTDLSMVLIVLIASLFHRIACLIEEAIEHADKGFLCDEYR